MTNLGYQNQGELLKDYSFTYDGANNIVQKNQDSFQYDLLNQLLYANLKGNFEIDPVNDIQKTGLVRDDFKNQKPLEFTLDEVELIELDYSVGSIGVDLLNTFPVTKVRLNPNSPVHRVHGRNLLVYVSEDNSAYTKVEGWKIVAGEKGVLEIVFDTPVNTRFIKIKCLYDNRTDELLPMNMATFINKPDEIIKVHYLVNSRQEQYVYNAVGNRTTETITQRYPVTRNYDYYPKSSRLKSNEKYNFDYDPNGNLIRKSTINGDIVWNYGYDLLNQLIKVTKNDVTVANYIYDESGLRLKKQGTNSSVYYIFDIGGNVLYEQENGEYLEYIYVLGKHFARIDGNLDNLAETTKYFYHTDHLGSTVLVTDEAGQQVWSSEYTPFGKQVSKEGEMDHVTQFTGKDLDEDTGLYYFNARWMDSELGRFISEDPLAQDPNLYSYSGNNPISRIDPSGLWYYEVDPDSGEMIATAEEDDTLSGLSSQYYGSTDYINQIATDNEIADADSIQEGQRFVLGDYTERAGKFHGSALRQSFINGDISYDALKTFSALYKLSNALEFNKEERQIIADIQNYFALAHSKGEITGEQLVKVRDYYGGWEFVDKNYGVTTANATGDELLVLGGMAAYRLAKVFGPMIWSSPFVQKLITNDTAKNPQVTVLGKWTEISIYKGSQYYNVLSINPTVYRVLEKFKLGWEANKLWLDRCAARGDIFFLGSEPYAWLGKGTAYSKELQYMYELGYRFIGNYLVKQ